MAFLVLGANSVSGYTVKNSLRFNSGSSDELTRTFASDGNRKTFTFSCWIKRTTIGTDQSIFFGDTAGTTNATQDSFYFNASNTLTFGGWNSGFFTSTMLFRDVSAWYHIVVGVDSTQATSANRIKFYVNGVEQAYTSGAGYPAQNADFGITKSGNHSFFGNDGQSGRGNGYLAETYLIDGQQLTPSSFGETDTDTGIWKPKAYTGTYGTNGFYLKFANSASLGTDSSGNGNTFTVNNLTSVDQSTDTPTNNFATFNSIKFTGGTLTEGNLKLDSSSASWKTRNSTIGVSTGKWFMEFKMGSISADQSGVAIVSDLTPDGNFPASDATRIPAIAYNSDGRKLVNGSATSAYFSAMSTNDIIGIALDMTGGTVQFYRNGSTTGSPINLSDAFTSANYPLFFAGAVFNTRDVQANFGSPPYSANSYTDGAGYGNFSYSVPSGYYSLCTANLSLYG